MIKGAVSNDIIPITQTAQNLAEEIGFHNNHFLSQS